MWQPDCSDARGALDEQGVWFCDGAVDDATAAGLRRDILKAHELGLLRQSGNKLAMRTADGARGGVTQEKPNIFEADVIAGGAVERPDVLEQCPIVARLLAREGELREQLNSVKPELRLDRLDQAKIQVNTGCGGAFPLHFDVSSDQGSRRLLTAIVYLNPEWDEGDGGEVELLPFPFPNVSVPPLGNRLVVFASNTTMHRVRPFAGSAGRCCVNLWFDGNVDLHFPPPLPLEDYDARAAKIVQILRRKPQELRAFCKLWYREEVAASFFEAFRPSAELDAAVKLHWEESFEVESRVAPATLEALRRCVPLEPQVEKADLEGLFDGFCSD